MLKQRIITAIFLGTILVLSVLLAPAQWLLGLLLLALLLAGWEWAKMSGLTQPIHQYGYALFIIVSSWAFNHFLDPLWLLVLSAIWWIVASLLVIAYPRRHSQYQNTIVKLLQGILTLIPVYVAFSWIYQQPQGRISILFLLLLVWAADSGAYVFGKCWGKHKIKPALSPGKSWEGAIGGFVSVSLLTWLANATMGLPVPHAQLFFMAWLVACGSIIGDFFESILKRDQGMKDSSQLLPGHGGIMDRIDSLTAAAPLFALLLMVL